MPSIRHTHGWICQNGSLLYDVQLPGTEKMTHGSGKVVPTEDLSGCLQVGDRVMIDGSVFKIMSRPRKGSFMAGARWKGADVAGLTVYGQQIRCEKKLPKGMQHAKHTDIVGR